MGKLAYLVKARACNRIVIGKTYWKSIVLLAALYGGNIVSWNEGEIKKLQVAENEVMRKMVGAPGYVAMAGVRGEIGIGTMKGRLVRGRLQYVRSMIQGEKRILGRLWEEMKQVGRGRIVESTRRFCDWAEIREEELETMTKTQLDSRIALVQDRIWREDLRDRTTLDLYREWKTEMRQEDCYDGRLDSVIWFRARTNCLTLGDRKRHWGEETNCFMCREGREDLRHFILDCDRLEEIRIGIIGLQRPRLEDWREVLGRFLYGEDGESGRRGLWRMWKERERLRVMEEET